MTQDLACFAFMFSALSVKHSRRGAGPGAERLGETEHSRENHVVVMDPVLIISARD